MTDKKLMAEDEKLAIDMKVIDLRNAGKVEEARNLAKTIPLSPALAALMKKRMGAEWVKSSGWNLSEAEAKFGQNWLGN
jgi:hypothetical protein